MFSNLTKVWLFILGTAFMILVVGYQVGGRAGLLLSFAIALAMNVLIFIFGDQKILTLLKSRQIEGQDPYGLLDLIKNKCLDLKIETPKVYIFESDLPTSFTLGHSWQSSSIGFSDSLLKKLTREELECVVAHQLCRIRSWDSFAYSVTSTLANTLLGFAQALDRFLPVKIFTWLITPISWLAIKLIVRNQNVFLNDQEASRLIADRFLLGKTLWKLQGYAENKPLALPPCLGHLFIVDPQSRQQKSFFTDFHPNIEVRLSRLIGYYPP